MFLSFLDTQFEAMKAQTMTSNVESFEGTNKTSTTSRYSDLKFFSAGVTQKMPITTSTVTPLENAYSINQSNNTEDVDPSIYNKSRN